MVGRRATVLAGAVALGLVAAVAHAEPTDRVIGHRSASGRHATATAYAETERAAKLAVRVTAKPNQRVTGFWGYRCALGVTIGDRDARDFARKTPFTLAMTQPRMAGTTNYTCNLVGSAKLSRRGRVTVELLER